MFKRLRQAVTHFVDQRVQCALSAHPFNNLLMRVEASDMDIDDFRQRLAQIDNAWTTIDAKLRDYPFFLTNWKTLMARVHELERFRANAETVVKTFVVILRNDDEADWPSFVARARTYLTTRHGADWTLVDVPVPRPEDTNEFVLASTGEKLRYYVFTIRRWVTPSVKEP